MRSPTRTVSVWPVSNRSRTACPPAVVTRYWSVACWSILGGDPVPAETTRYCTPLSSSAKSGSARLSLSNASPVEAFTSPSRMIDCAACNSASACGAVSMPRPARASRIPRSTQFRSRSSGCAARPLPILSPDAVAGMGAVVVRKPGVVFGHGSACRADHQQNGQHGRESCHGSVESYRHGERAASLQTAGSLLPVPRFPPTWSRAPSSS